jgi:hypothetical protein
VARCFVVELSSGSETNAPTPTDTFSRTSTDKTSTTRKKISQRDGKGDEKSFITTADVTPRDNLTNARGKGGLMKNNGCDDVPSCA